MMVNYEPKAGSVNAFEGVLFNCRGKKRKK